MVQTMVSNKKYEKIWAFSSGTLRIPSNLSISLSAKDVFFMGLRALEPCEVDLLDFYNIKYLDMASIDRMDLVVVSKWFNFSYKSLNECGAERERDRVEIWWRFGETQ